MDVKIIAVPNSTYYNKFEQTTDVPILKALREEYDCFDEICYVNTREINCWWAYDYEFHRGWVNEICDFSKEYPHYDFVIEYWDFDILDENDNYLDGEFCYKVNIHNGTVISD